MLRATVMEAPLWTTAPNGVRLGDKNSWDLSPRCRRLGTRNRRRVNVLPDGVQLTFSIIRDVCGFLDPHTPQARMRSRRDPAQNAHHCPGGVGAGDSQMVKTACVASSKARGNYKKTGFPRNASSIARRLASRILVTQIAVTTTI